MEGGIRGETKVVLLPGRNSGKMVVTSQNRNLTLHPLMITYSIPHNYPLLCQQLNFYSEEKTNSYKNGPQNTIPK